MVDFVFGRIDIFGGLLVFFQHSSTKTDSLACGVVDGEDDTAAISVVQLSTFRLLDKTQLQQKFLLISLFNRLFGEGVPSAGAVAQFELVKSSVHEPAFLEVGET